MMNQWHPTLFKSAAGIALVATTWLMTTPAQAKPMAEPTAEPAQVKPMTEPTAEPTQVRPMAEPPATPVMEAPQTTGTIVDVAASSSSFSTLVAALKAAGLVETLSGKGPFTVFAPTDAAFAALPAGTVENLLKPENKAKLIKILTYHVVSGKVESKMLKSGPAKTVEGAAVEVKVKDGKVMVNKANVTAADVSASNGVIHVIDRVLLPPDRK
jgi:uncharacterized surface protein with fasciclin (FAS1) repeats